MASHLRWKMKKNLIKKVLNTMERFDMVESGHKVLVAVSGGPDSVFLLHALYALKDTVNIKLSVGNLDHGLRGRASEIDSKFVRHFSESLNMPFVYKKVNREVYKNRKLSKEEIARKERYAFLIKTAKKLGIETIATGHTLDDQVETILMRIIKGTTLKGVMGIPAVRYEDGIKIIRPLIDINKQDIEIFLTEGVIPCRTDHTNLEDVYFRNKIRNRVLPYLAKYNPRIKDAITNLAESLREDFEFIEDERRRRKIPFHREGNRLALSLKDIVIQPKALRKEIIKDALSKAGSNIKKLSYRHWKDVDNFIKTRQKGKSIDLPGGIRISKTQSSLEFFKLKNTPA